MFRPAELQTLLFYKSALVPAATAANILVNYVCRQRGQQASVQGRFQAITEALHYGSKSCLPIRPASSSPSSTCVQLLTTRLMAAVAGDAMAFM